MEMWLHISYRLDFLTWQAREAGVVEEEEEEDAGRAPVQARPNYQPSKSRWVWH